MSDTAGLLALAAVQGLAEFLPISSSGHLVLAEKSLGIDNPGPALEIFLHAGTLLSICAFYRRTLLRLALSALRGRREGLLYAGYVLLSMVPAGLAYAFFKDQMASAFDSTRAVGWLLLANAALLLLSAATDRLRPSGGGPTALRALAMGLGQAVAILPGISRSGTSIHAGRLAGMSPAKAAEFSFLMSIPVIAGGVAMEGSPALCGDGGLSAWPLALSTAVSAAVGYAALLIVQRTLAAGKFWMFGIWCAAVGALAVAWG